VHRRQRGPAIAHALDHLWADAFANRPVALASNAGAVRGSSTAREHLRSVVEALSGWRPDPDRELRRRLPRDRADRRLVNETVRRRCKAIVEFARCVIALAFDADVLEASALARHSA
jgi:hypothetical protein